MLLPGWILLAFAAGVAAEGAVNLRTPAPSGTDPAGALCVQGG